jgi:Predicted membrane protein (DUF2254)
MGWGQRYRLKRYLASSLWIIPFAAIPLALALTRVLENLDQWLGWTLLGLALGGASGAVPDHHRSHGESPGIFVRFTARRRSDRRRAADPAHHRHDPATRQNREICGRSVHAYAVLCGERAQPDGQGRLPAHRVRGRLSRDRELRGISLSDRLCGAPVAAGKHSRPVGDSGITVVDSVYPDPAAAAAPADPTGRPLGVPSRVLNHERTSGIVLAANVPALLAAAEKAGGAIEFAPQVGDFVARGDPLFKLYGGAASIDPSALIENVVFGSERTLDQDPTFAFRIIVDIALRALSPAINDPTTAVLAIDQLHRMLRLVGQRNPTASSAMRKSCVCTFGHRTGRISCISRSARSVTAARTICRSCAACEP